MILTSLQALADAPQFKVEYVEFHNVKFITEIDGKPATIYLQAAGGSETGKNFCIKMGYSGTNYRNSGDYSSQNYSDRYIAELDANGQFQNIKPMSDFSKFYRSIHCSM